jgi:acyl-CoA thioester hydrolase
MRLSFNTEAFHLAADVRVRWADTDATGIAYNGAYLTWLEVARVEYFRAVAAFANALALDAPEVQHDLLALYPLSFSLAGCCLDWRAPVRVDTRLRVAIRTSRLGRSAVDQQYRLTRLRDEALVALAESTIVHVDPQTFRSRELPASMRDEVQRFERALGEGSIAHTPRPG